MFKTAIMLNLKLRMALCGPAGAGKTYSALAIAHALGGKIAVVDTEHGSASRYANTFAFDVVEPALYDPRDLIETIKFAEANGYSTIIIDSLSHYWSGKGGELEMVDAAVARSKSGNSFAAWKSVTPVHNELIETILASKINVLATMRSKTEWVIETVNGKQCPRKIGLAPVMRDGIEFEFDVVGDLDQENNFTVTKSRCSALSGKVINRPGKQLAETLQNWLNSGSKDAAEQPAVTPAPAPKPVMTKEAPKPKALPPKTTTLPRTPTLADKTIGKDKPAPEFVPEDAVIVPPTPDIVAAQTPKAAAAETVSEADARHLAALDKLRELAAAAHAPEAEPEAKPADAPVNTGQLIKEYDAIRAGAKAFGCKTLEDFAGLTLTVVGERIDKVTSLTTAAQRNAMLEFFANAEAEREAA